MKRNCLLAVALLSIGISAMVSAQDSVPTGRSFFIKSAGVGTTIDMGYWDLPGQQPSFTPGDNLALFQKDRQFVADQLFQFIPAGDGWYKIRSSNGGMIDVVNGGTQNGTNITAYTENGSRNQLFRFKHLGGGRYKIYAFNGGIVAIAGAGNYQNGTNIHLWEDHNASWVEWYLEDAQTGICYDPNQRQNNAPATSNVSMFPIGRYFFIKSVQSQNLDIGYWDQPGYPAQSTEGTKLLMFARDNNFNNDQQYKFVLEDKLFGIGSGWYYIAARNGGVVDVENGSAANGTPIQIYNQSQGNSAQLFKMVHLGGGRFKIYARNGGVICAAGRSHSNGNSIVIWEDHEGPWMEWYLIDAITGQRFVPAR